MRETRAPVAARVIGLAGLWIIGAAGRRALRRYPFIRLEVLVRGNVRAVGRSRRVGKIGVRGKVRHRRKLGIRADVGSIRTSFRISFRIRSFRIGKVRIGLEVRRIELCGIIARHISRGLGRGRRGGSGCGTTRRRRKWRQRQRTKLLPLTQTLTRALPRWARVWTRAWARVWTRLREDRRAFAGCPLSNLGKRRHSSTGNESRKRARGGAARVNCFAG